MRRWGESAGLWLAIVALGQPLPARCQEAPAPPPRGFFERDTLGGDWAGLRSALGKFGTTLAITYTGEVFDVLRGGLRRGASYEGLLQLDLDVDLGTAVGWTDAAFHTTAYQIHGQGTTLGRLGNIMTISGNEGTPSTRLGTLWLEQGFLSKSATLRIGQLAVDDEFFISQYAIPLVNGTFGWPAIPSVNLPDSGPAYPLATPGVRLKAMPMPALSAMIAVFNGDPVPPGAGDPEHRDPSGTAFRLNDDVLTVGEVGYAAALKGASGIDLPGSYKLGGWFHSGRFQDQRFDAAGRSLADPASSRVPASHRGNFGGYAVVDQALSRRSDSEDQGAGLFFRLALSPGDRAVADVYADAGITVKGPLPRRDNDIASLGFAYTRISPQARGLDRDAIAFRAIETPVRDYEALVELTYQLQIAPWLIVQPDLQVVFHPGGNIADPNDRSGSRPIRDALIFGLRTVLKL